LFVFDYFGFGVLRCPHCITLFQVLCLHLFYFSVPSSLIFSLLQCCTTQQRQVRKKLALLWFVGLEKEDSETREREREIRASELQFSLFSSIFYFWDKKIYFIFQLIFL
jgi:hypothetical protein